MKVKNKILVFTLLVCLIIAIQGIFSNQVEAVSVEEYQSKINNIIAQWENKSFNESEYSTPSVGWVHNSFYTCSACGYGGWECLAFARYCQNQFYGTCDVCGDYEWLYSGSINSIADLRVGDVIRYRSAYSDHSIVIIDTYQDRNIVRIIDCNSNYDDHIVRVSEKSFDEIKNYLNSGTLYEGGTPHLLRAKGNNVTTLQQQIKEPKITQTMINTVSTTPESILVRAKVENSEEVSNVQMSIWRSGYGDNTISTTKTAIWDSASGSYQVRFDESDIKQGTDGVVCVNVWVTDKSGKKTSEKSIYDFAFAGKADLGSFTARIVPKNNTNYCIGISGKNNGDALTLKTKDINDDTQLWRFERKSDGFYKIINVSADKSMDINGGIDGDADESLIQLWNYVSTADQMQFMLQSYNGGYRIVPVFTSEMRGLDIADGKMENNRAIRLYRTCRSDNEAQTFIFEKVTTDISLNKTSTTMYVGNTETLNVTINPTDAVDKNVIWKSNNTEVATVDSYGVVTAKAVGTATITATTADGKYSVSCQVTVDCSHKNTTTHKAIASTCLVQGNAEYITCDDCGEVISGSNEKLSLADHNYGNLIEKVEPIHTDTTLADGMEAHYECSVCGKLFNENKEEVTEKDLIIEAPLHNYGDWVADNNNHWKEGGCGNIIELEAHKGGEATCISKAICEVCNLEYGEVDSSNHKNTETRNAVEATTEKKGYTGDIYCLDCGKLVKEGEVIPVLTEEPVKPEIDDTKPTEPEEGNDTKQPIDDVKEEKEDMTDKTKPQTDDNSNMGLWISLLVISIISFIIIAKWNTKIKAGKHSK